MKEDILARNFKEPLVLKELALEIECNRKKILVISIYAPNDVKEKYFLELKNKLESTLFEQIIIFRRFQWSDRPQM